MTLGKHIRDCRYAKGWGPDELASRAEISRTALYQIERGKTGTPRAGTLRRIARALDVSIELFLGDDPLEGVSEALADEGHRGDSLAPVLPTIAGTGRELDRKFHELLASPLGEGLARIVEESHRFLPARNTV